MWPGTRAVRVGGANSPSFLVVLGRAPNFSVWGCHSPAELRPSLLHREMGVDVP